MTELPAYQNAPLCWAASMLCCAGILWLAFSPLRASERILRSATFLPTFTVGILAWLLHSVDIGSHALFWPCLIQFTALLFLMVRATRIRRSPP